MQGMAWTKSMECSAGISQHEHAIARPADHGPARGRPECGVGCGVMRLTKACLTSSICAVATCPH